MTDRPGEAYIHRWNELVKRLMGSKGGEPLHELAPELMVGLEIEQEILHPEWWILGGTLLYATRQAIAAAIGNNGRMQFQNPIGSGVVITFLEILATNQPAVTATQYDLSTITGASFFGGAAVAGSPQDGRANQFGVLNVGPLLAASLNTGVGSAGAIRSRKEEPPNSVGAIWTLGLPILTPGTGIEVRDVTVNEAMSVEIVYLVRALEQSEAMAR